MKKIIVLLAVFLGVVSGGNIEAVATKDHKSTVKETNVMKDQEAIKKVLNLYIQAGLQGKSEVMKTAFHPQAIMYGHTGGKLVGGPIQSLFDGIDNGPPAKDLKAEITKIEVVEKIATAQVKSSNWLGASYSDMFLLVKDGEDWKILTKIFFHHEN